MNLTKKRWMILIASCLINLCIGALYAWSVFASGMAEYLSSVNHSIITTSSLAIVFSIANMVGPITMIGGGKLVRSIGPRWVITIGGVCFGLGMIISGFAQSVGMLVFGFGLCCGLAMGMTYGCTVGMAGLADKENRIFYIGIAIVLAGIVIGLGAFLKKHYVQEEKNEE